MPLVIHPRQYAAWLDPQTENPAELMKPLDNGEVEAYAVSTAVNDPKRDDPSCVERTGSA